MKKGRHRRFEEARSLKRAIEVVVEPCPECGADPEDDHASWCLYEETEDEDEDEYGSSDGLDEASLPSAGRPSAAGPTSNGASSQNGNGSSSH